MSFHSMAEIISAANREELPFWEVILKDDMQEREVSRAESMAEMKRLWEAMVFADTHYERDRVSTSGLVGGAGGKMEDYLEKGTSLCGDFTGRVIMRALRTGESNACMKRIVAAPTAGASGVLPAVLITMYMEREIPEGKILEALYTAAGIGQIIAKRACIAGAQGGCQAEIGSASAMAAGALTHLQGGSTEQIGEAVSMALKNLLGLVCDPVAGLVEVPCVKRNVIGAVNALSAADMAMAGIASVIPVDQVIDAMGEVGEKMHVSLKETGIGGLAGTKTGQEIMEKFQKIES